MRSTISLKLTSANISYLRGAESFFMSFTFFLNVPSFIQNLSFIIVLTISYLKILFWARLIQSEHSHILTRDLEPF
jgi:hypothetical protein